MGGRRRANGVVDRPHTESGGGGGGVMMVNCGGSFVVGDSRQYLRGDAHNEIFDRRGQRGQRWSATAAARA